MHKSEEKDMRNLNSREYQPSGDQVESMNKKVESRANARDDDPHDAEAGLLVLRDTNSERRAWRDYGSLRECHWF